MHPEIKNLSLKKMIGMRMEMSFADNHTFMLWKNFMPRKHEVKHVIGIEVYSMQLYPVNFFKKFDSNRTFEKWAAVEVAAVKDIPSQMEYIELAEGMYAVFLYKGDASNAAATFQHILGNWLPASIYELDSHRLHFEILGSTYKKGDPDSEEEIWIPIRQK